MRPDEGPDHPGFPLRGSTGERRGGVGGRHPYETELSAERLALRPAHTANPWGARCLQECLAPCGGPAGLWGPRTGLKSHAPFSRTSVGSVPGGADKEAEASPARQASGRRQAGAKVKPRVQGSRASRGEGRPGPRPAPSASRGALGGCVHEASTTHARPAAGARLLLCQEPGLRLPGSYRSLFQRGCLPPALGSNGRRCSRAGARSAAGPRSADRSRGSPLHQTTNGVQGAKSGGWRPSLCTATFPSTRPKGLQHEAQVASDRRAAAPIGGSHSQWAAGHTPAGSPGPSPLPRTLLTRHTPIS